MVRPPVCDPLPIVEDANAVMPPLNCVSVLVALSVRGKGYALEPLPHALAFAEIVPSAPTCKQRVPAPPAEEMTRFVLLAVPVTKRCAVPLLPSEESLSVLAALRPRTVSETPKGMDVLLLK